MNIVQQPHFLRTVLLVDAVTCLATGLLMTVGAGTLSPLTAIPTDLLVYAGVSLFPVAAFIIFVATRPEPPVLGVWLVIFGNVAWVAGSVWLLSGGALSPTALGEAFIALQAAAVAVLAGLEYAGLRWDASHGLQPGSSNRMPS